MSLIRWWLACFFVSGRDGVSSEGPLQTLILFAVAVCLCVCACVCVCVSACVQPSTGVSVCVFLCEFKEGR